ncbi:hypothetical protein AAFF_G00409880 [Aldrovandia affinis]|uniref:Uncharacterized protein n=1 Tax=Aldrovandia affinis TaxID=143900 RepID=A0AAD7SC10_9TELE|nr:hypothetical protein AAFF_G00409880 [Aldrovandia affinis]
MALGHNCNPFVRTYRGGSDGSEEGELAAWFATPAGNATTTPGQRLKLSKPVVRRVKVWSSEARERLSAWLERAGCDQGLMEWAGPEAGNNLDEYTDTVISFISFCEEVCVPVRTRKIYNNDKPWFSAQLRRLRSEKEEARRSGDKDRFKEAKYRFAKAAKEAKHRFSEKLQQQFSEGNPASVWKGLKTITNYKPKSPQTSDNLSLANELNEFYCRFEKEREGGEPSV